MRRLLDIHNVQKTSERQHYTKRVPYSFGSRFLILTDKTRKEERMNSPGHFCVLHDCDDNDEPTHPRPPWLGYGLLQ